MRTSSIPAGAVVEGSIRGAGDLVVRGTVEGPITLDGVLTIEAAALVRGEVRARSIVIKGTLEGPAHASELLRLEPGARLLGDVSAERISAASGALVRGRVRMAGADRLRRTVGGTLEAPFSSAGSIPAGVSSAGAIPAVVEAPRSAAIREYVTTPASAPAPTIRTQLTAPAPPPEPGTHAVLEHTQPFHSERLDAARAPAPTLAPDPDPAPRRQTERTGPLPVEAEVRVPPIPEALAPRDPALRPRNVAARNATPPPPTASPRAADPSPRPQAPARGAAPKAPPPPVVPTLGRVRVRRRDEASS